MFRKKLFFILLSLICTNIIASAQYFAIVQPMHTYTIKSSVSGKVTFVNNPIEGKFSKNEIIVEIDKTVNKIELEKLQLKYKILEQTISIENSNYEKLKQISSKSKYEKDNQKIKILNLQSSKADLEIKIATFEEKIQNKTLKEKNNYIYDIAIQKGNYVTPGTILYTAHDLSRAKLEIFIPISEANTIKDKIIYIDGIKTKYKINKIFKVADLKHISTYKCEILIDDTSSFSKLAKVEFK